MSTHYARTEHSARLRRVLHVLSDGREHSTLDLLRRSRTCAVNSCVAELRDNGYHIHCQRRGDRWYYQMETAASGLLRA